MEEENLGGQNMNNSSQSGQGFPGGNKKWLVIAIIVVIVMAAGVWGWLYYKKKTAQPINSGPGNGSMMGGEEGNLLNGASEPLKIEAVANLFLKTETETVSAGEEFTVGVLMDTKGYNLSAASAALEFDNDLLEAVKVDASESVMTFAVESGFDNDAGRVNIVRGKPGDADPMDTDDGYTGSDGVLATVIFRAKAMGEASINFDRPKSKLILDDARGTEMNLDYGDAVISIIGSE